MAIPQSTTTAHYRTADSFTPGNQQNGIQPYLSISTYAYSSSTTYGSYDSHPDGGNPPNKGSDIQ